MNGRLRSDFAFIIQFGIILWKRNQKIKKSNKKHDVTSMLSQLYLGSSWVVSPIFTEYPPLSIMVALLLTILSLLETIFSPNSNIKCHWTECSRFTAPVNKSICLPKLHFSHWHWVSFVTYMRSAGKCTNHILTFEKFHNHTIVDFSHFSCEHIKIGENF